MACDVVEMASGVRLVWARRDGAGVPVAAAVSSSTVPAAAFALVPSSALSASLLVVSACACCSAVVRGWMASAMAAMGIVALAIDVHAIAQSR